MKTEGNFYKSEGEFFQVCTSKGIDRELNLEKIFSRVYSIENLRVLANNLSFPLVEFDKSVNESGVKKTYALAHLLINNFTRQTLAEGMQDLEHTLYFPFISFFKLPKADVVSSASKYREFLISKGFEFKNQKCSIFNGLINPKGRYPDLESIKINTLENEVSMIFSCNRFQFSPISNSTSYENSFLCRIPVVVTFIFGRNLVEVNMPFYYEHHANKINAEGDYPQRIQQIFENIMVSINKLLPRPVGGVDYNNLTLHLEEKCSAVDMGWQIEPQQSASFDAKQNVIPLNQIFMEFEESLKKECEAMGKDSPFENYKLYSIFRAIKERGHTLQFNLKVPLGEKGKNVILLLIYGAKNTGYPPLIRLSYCKSDIIKRLREEVWKTSLIPKYKNPYELYSLLSKN